MSEKIALAYDFKEYKVGCVLLQAVFGGSSIHAQKFNNHYWLVSPTDNLRLYEFTEEEISVLADMTHLHHTEGPEAVKKKYLENHES